MRINVPTGPRLPVKVQNKTCGIARSQQTVGIGSPPPPPPLEEEPPPLEEPLLLGEEEEDDEEEELLQHSQGPRLISIFPLIS